MREAGRNPGLSPFSDLDAVLLIASHEENALVGLSMLGGDAVRTALSVRTGSGLKPAEYGERDTGVHQVSVEFQRG